ncbi:MAG: hypothetical protein ACTHMB_00685, partial [Candidatus Binatia bacterium]
MLFACQGIKANSVSSIRKTLNFPAHEVVNAFTSHRSEFRLQCGCVLPNLFDNVEIAKRMVLNGLGYCIAPSIVLEKNDKLHKIYLNETSGSPIVWKTR